MKYTFNIDEKENTKEEKNINLHFKIYNFIQDFENSVSILLGLIIFFIIDYFCKIDPVFIFNKLNLFFKIIFSLTISKLLFSILSIIFNVDKLYLKVSNLIGHDILVRELIVFNDEKNDKLEESETVPGIKIRYDIKKVSNKNFALVFKIDDENYKVVDILKCDHLEINAEKILYSNEILKNIRETEDKCVKENGLLFSSIVLLKNNKIEKGNIITERDVDTRLLLTEVFFFPFIHTKKEGNV